MSLSGEPVEGLNAILLQFFEVKFNTFALPRTFTRLFCGRPLAGGYKKFALPSTGSTSSPQASPTDYDVRGLAGQAVAKYPSVSKKTFFIFFFSPGC
jgi:hypothetical protein